MDIIPSKNRAVLTISGTYNGFNVNFTLTEQNGIELYSRTYSCTIDNEDNITFPNDLTSRIQTLCQAVCLCLKYRNTYEGDAKPTMAATTGKA